MTETEKQNPLEEEKTTPEENNEKINKEETKEENLTEKKGEDKVEKKEEEKKEENDDNNIELDFVEKAHTYIYYKLSFSESINPRLKGTQEETEPDELIEEKNIHYSAPNEKVDKIEKEEVKEHINNSEIIDNNKIVDALTGKNLPNIPEYEEKKRRRRRGRRKY
jgi:hypothetical protein